MTRIKDTDLRQERDRALYRAYNEAILHNDFASQKEAFDYVRTHPAPKFYISAEFCAIVIGRMRAGKDMGVCGEQRIRKFQELYRRYKVERAKPENFELSTQDICNIIVDQEAPEFYLNHRATSGIILQQKEQWLNELMVWGRK